MRGNTEIDRGVAWRPEDELRADREAVAVTPYRYACQQRNEALAVVLDAVKMLEDRLGSALVAYDTRPVCEEEEPEKDAKEPHSAIVEDILRNSRELVVLADNIQSIISRLEL